MFDIPSRKIFVSYKYGDSEVFRLPSVGLLEVPTARHYVDALTNLFDRHDHIYKGENDNESLAGFKNETIESKLRAKIFDSSITVVLISKNMKDQTLSESDQWIPWEISYSLKEMTKGDRTRGTSAVIAVILPDKAGSYSHFINSACANGCVTWLTGNTFEIIAKNMFNRKQPRTFSCTHGSVHSGNDHSYIYPVKWDDFVANVNGHITNAVNMRDSLSEYTIVKAL